MNLFVLTSLLLLETVLFAGAGEKYNLKKVQIPNDSNIRVFTTEELKEFDGSDPEKPIYIGIKGVVFDVSKGKGFYGKGASYNALVGKDSSRAVAKMSLEPEDLTNDLTGLNDRTLKSLDDVFDGTYMTKYPVAGYMDYLVEGRTEKLRRNIEDL